MQTINIMGWSLTHKARAQPVTAMQKFCMVIVGGSFAFAVIMVALETLDVIQEDVTHYRYMIVSMFSAGVGYLFGNNVRTPTSDSGTQ